LDFTGLTTERLTIRRLEVEDADFIYRYRSSYEVSRYQLWRPKDVEEVEAFIESLRDLAPDTPGTWYQVGICLSASGGLIGDCGLHFPEDKPGEAEVGITLVKEHRKQGYATEALAAVITYLLNNLQKQRVYATIDARNKPAIGLVRRLGLRIDSLGRTPARVGDESPEEVVYTIDARGKERF
jgi:RimJ/RimL family protein N-acetyltransferase